MCPAVSSHTHWPPAALGPDCAAATLPSWRPVSVNEKNKEALRRKWILAGRPRWPDWKEMLTGVVPQEAIDKVYGEGEQQEQ